MEQNPFKSGRYLCHELLESMITTISNHANSYLTSCCKHFLQSLATDERKELPLPHFKFLFLKALYNYTSRLPIPIISP